MSQRWQHIAVIRPCCIGDAVFALPTVAALRAAAPQARIDIWTGQHSAEIHRRHGVADNLHLMPDVPGIAAAAGLARRIVASGADLVVLLDRSRLLRGVLRTTLGPQRTLAAMAPDAAPQGHEIDRFLDVVIPLGVSRIDAVPHLRRSASVHPATNIKPVAVLHIGGGGNPGTLMPSKQWPSQHIATAIELLHAAGWDITLLGGPDDVARVPGIVSRVDGVPTQIAVGDLSLAESIDVIANAAGYIGPDTGLTHVAAALGVPTVAVFGPTNPERYAPRGERVHVAAPQASWSAQHGDLRRQVTADQDAATTEQVAPDGVVDALLTLERMPTLAGAQAR